MKREILFRGMRVDGGKWVEGDLIHCLGHCYIQNIGNPPNDTEYQGPVQVIPETVGQYTGLKDKNGVMVFDGDIIKYDDTESMNIWVSGEVAHIINLGFKTVARMSPFDKFNGSNQNILSDDFSDCVEKIRTIHDKELKGGN